MTNGRCRFWVRGMKRRDAVEELWHNPTLYTNSVEKPYINPYDLWPLYNRIFWQLHCRNPIKKSDHFPLLRSGGFYYSKYLEHPKDTISWCLFYKLFYSDWRFTYLTITNVWSSAAQFSLNCLAFLSCCLSADECVVRCSVGSLWPCMPVEKKLLEG